MGQTLSRNLKKKNHGSLAADIVLPEGFKWQDGRTYRDDKCLASMTPVNNTEIGRINAQHYLWRFVLQGNFQAPIGKELKRGINVLQVGCDTGIWAAEMATQYPRSNFTATDAVNSFKGMSCPDNCNFQVVNTLRGLPFDDDTFDYVFQRAQAIAYPEKAWPNVIEEFVRVTKPGGYIEIVEAPFHIHEGGPQTKFYIQQLNLAVKAQGLNGNIGKILGSGLSVAGLEEIHYDYRSCPLGWGHPELGRLTKLNLCNLMKQMKPRVTDALNMPDDKYDTIVAEVDDELGERYQGFANVEIYVARKPGGLSASK